MSATHPPARAARAFHRTPLAQAALLACLVLAPALHCAHAQTAAGDAAAATSRYDIPAGPLDQALNRFAAQAGVLLAIDASLTTGKTSAGLRTGSHVPRVDGLLAGAPRRIGARVLRTAGAHRNVLRGLAWLGTGSLLMGALHETPRWQSAGADHVTRTGERREVELTDGTRVRPAGGGVDSRVAGGRTRAAGGFFWRAWSAIVRASSAAILRWLACLSPACTHWPTSTACSLRWPTRCRSA